MIERILAAFGFARSETQAPARQVVEASQQRQQQGSADEHDDDLRDVHGVILSLKAYRQKLRDLPQTNHAACEACATPETLAAWEPTWPQDPVP